MMQAITCTGDLDKLRMLNGTLTLQYITFTVLTYIYKGKLTVDANGQGCFNITQKDICYHI